MPQIHVINRKGGGSRETFTAPTVTFGRDSGNMIVTGGEHTSRLHGELRCEADRWLLVNLSSNGTELNGRRVTRKPRPLQDHDVIGVAGETLFEVRIDEPSPTTPSDGDDEESVQAMSKRTRLWLFIGIYLVLMLGAFFFLNTLKQEKQERQQATAPLTREQIEQEIRSPLPPMPVNPPESAQELNTANELIDRLDSSPDATYRCYMAYKKSLALSGRPHFEPGTDLLHCQQVQQRLIDSVSSTYAQAYQELKSGQFRKAIDGFRRLTDIYPDTTGRIHENVRQQQAIAVERLGKRRRR